MIIQMIVQMSGGRYDDRTWPLPWHDFEVPDDEGRGLIRCGAAMEVVGALATKATPAPPVKAAPSVKAMPAPSVKAAPVAPAKADPVPSVQAVPVAPAKAPEAEMPQPAPGDPRSAWIDYAVSRGAPRAEANERTKTQLQAVYGGRL